MPEPLNGPALGEWLAAKIVKGEITMRTGLTTLGERMEARMKDNASQGEHQRGTQTPASPGSGPAVISGDLRRSITHTPIESISGLLQTRVGPASTPHSDSSATSGEIGRYLEKDGRGSNRYPFVEPAHRDTVPEAAGIFKATWDALP